MQANPTLEINVDLASTYNCFEVKTFEYCGIQFNIKNKLYLSWIRRFIFFSRNREQSYVPKMELCAQDARHFYFFTRKTGRWRGWPQTYGLCSENKNILDREESRGGESFFFGRGSVAPSTRSASQTAIEPIEPGLIPITPHITPCITLYTHIPRTPPPPTPVGGITLENHNLSTETSVNQQSNRHQSLLEKSLPNERNTHS